MKARLAVLLLLLLAPAAVRAQTADVVGRWEVTITLADGTVSGIALLERDNPDYFIGSIGHDEDNQHPLHGIVNGNRVTIWTDPPGPGISVAFERCTLIRDGDTMTGKIESGRLAEGSLSIEFVRQRPGPG